jgi:2-methylisocitrate lyase-like PEP mutase family enzyme
VAERNPMRSSKPTSRSTPARRRLRALLCQDVPVVAPGIFDGLSARLGGKAGLEVVHASGGAMARSMGYPDLGVVTLTEVLGRLTEICAAGPAVIADADTGFGGAHNVERTVREFERVGVAALHIEDQTFPKRCGLMQGVGVVSLNEASARIIAAVAGRSDPDMQIIARTDAVADEGLSRACERIQAYLDAGADIAFIEGLDTPDLIREAAALITGPKLLNLTRARDGLPFSLKTLRSMGYVILIAPGDAQSAATAAMNAIFAALRDTGHTRDVAHLLTTSQIRDDAVETSAYFARETDWARDPAAQPR